MREPPGWSNAPITRAAFGVPYQRGPRNIEREWSGLTSRDQDVIVYWAGAWNRGGRHLCWGWCAWHVAAEDGRVDEPHPALRAPASKIERLLSPIAHEARIRIMQAMYDRPKTSGELSAATGLKGGNLYYHLKELIHGAYVTERGKGYDLTGLGCQMLVTVSMIAEQVVRDRGEAGLLSFSPRANSTPLPPSDTD